jgi:hypothetical protein
MDGPMKISESLIQSFENVLMHLLVDVLMVRDVTTPARQLFDYLLSHGKVYNMEVFRMVPVPVTALNDSDYGKYDADSDVIVIVNHFLYFVFNNISSLSLEVLGRKFLRY